MVRFATETLGLERVQIGGVEANMFALPDGSYFAVADPRSMCDTSRSVGFLVADLDEAVAELRKAGVEVGEPPTNDRHRYIHFRAPDGKLYRDVSGPTPSRTRHQDPLPQGRGSTRAHRRI